MNKQSPSLHDDIIKSIDTLTNSELNEILFNLRYYKQQINQQEYNDLFTQILHNKNFSHIEDNTLIFLSTGNADFYDEMISLEKTKPSFEHLIQACKSTFFKNHDFNLIHKILTHKIIPTHECFKWLISAKKQKTIIYNIPFKTGLTFDNKICKNIINMMIAHGLTLNLTDVKKLASRSIEIDLKIFDITPDNELINICLEHDFFPKYLNNCEINESQLHKLFTKKHTLKNIETLIEKHNLKCDVVCLQNACNIKNNSDVINFLIEKQDVIPDITCLKTIINNYCTSDTVKKVVHMVP
jgi:hypothetical protein